MAAKAGTKPTKPAAGKSAAGGKNAALKKAQLEDLRRGRQRKAMAAAAAALLILLLALLPGENIWRSAHNFVYGTAGIGVFLWVVFLGYCSAVWWSNRDLRKVWAQTLGLAVLILCFGALVFLFGHDAKALKEISWEEHVALAYAPPKRNVWTAAAVFNSGGVLGAVLGAALGAACGRAGGITLAVFLFICNLFVFSAKAREGLSNAVNQFTNRPPRPDEETPEAPTAPAPKKSKKKPAAEEPAKAPAAAATVYDAAFDQMNAMIDHPAQEEEGEEPQRKGWMQSRKERRQSRGLDDTMPIPALPETEKSRGGALPKDVRLELGEPAPALDFDAIPIGGKPKVKPRQEIPADISVEDLAQTIFPSPDHRRKAQKAGEDLSAVKEPAAVPGEIIPPEEEDTPAYQTPPLTCLAQPRGANSQPDRGEEDMISRKLVRTLESFGVQVEMVGLSRGPSVTRYELRPAEGIKISKITGLSDDIALRLAATKVRIEAPIPGKPAVGVEVPNRNRAVVTLRELVDSEVFRAGRGKSILTVALGKDIVGSLVCTDLAKIPHLLIAGTTGSGKSVCMNALILSLLYNATPEEVKLVMVDPKQVEFTVYSGIPHLLVPVVSDPLKAAGALSWAVNEMERRYKLLSEHNVRESDSYNRVADKLHLERLPKIVIFIDELSDLMMVAPSDVEDAIQRLTQKARAAGIHLVLATQRPSVDVITGVIKSNLPGRIALSVASQIDSRTIINTAGAEQLLGNGDMLFSLNGGNNAIRVQGCYVSDAEVQKVVRFVRDQGAGESYSDEIMEEINRNAAAAANARRKGGATSAGDGEDEGEDDEMLQRAVEVVVDAQMASTTMLQKKLKLGYARASRLVDELEARGFVGAYEGSKPRKVLLSKPQWLEMVARSPDKLPEVPAKGEAAGE
ncbi:MAG: DNA translocase FtsK [Oscillospiraceae bacterium]|nr:DNA translocase FtsK [Oscillospiraceae bacterium]